MPTYEYECNACKHTFSLVRTIAEHEKRRVVCPKCKGRKVKQRISVFRIKTSRKS